MLDWVVQLGPVETVASAQNLEEVKGRGKPRGVLVGEQSHERV